MSIAKLILPPVYIIAALIEAAKEFNKSIEVCP
jgi:hypothetical protein